LKKPFRAHFSQFRAPFAPDCRRLAEHLFGLIRCWGGVGKRWENKLDRQTKHEILIVAIASLVPIPLITAAAISILH
jgi:hypothetical protein